MSTLSIVLLVLVILLVVGAMPTWPYSRGWGWGVTGGPLIILVILIVLLLTGHLG